LTARLFFRASGQPRPAALVYGSIAAIALGGAVALVLLAFTLYGLSTSCAKPRSEWVNPLPPDARVVERSGWCEQEDRYDHCRYRVVLEVPGSTGSAVHQVAKHYEAKGHKMLELSDGSWVNGTDGSGEESTIQVHASDTHSSSVVVSASRMIDSC
jgi:hypothetical protein